MNAGFPHHAVECGQPHKCVLQSPESRRRGRNVSPNNAWLQVTFIGIAPRKSCMPTSKPQWDVGLLGFATSSSRFLGSTITCSTLDQRPNKHGPKLIFLTSP
jgi:hypothetical protein